MNVITELGLPFPKEIHSDSLFGCIIERGHSSTWQSSYYVLSICSKEIQSLLELKLHFNALTKKSSYFIYFF